MHNKREFLKKSLAFGLILTPIGELLKKNSLKKSNFKCQVEFFPLKNSIQSMLETSADWIDIDQMELLKKDFHEQGKLLKFKRTVTAKQLLLKMEFATQDDFLLFEKQALTFIDKNKFDKAHINKTIKFHT